MKTLARSAPALLAACLAACGGASPPSPPPAPGGLVVTAETVLGEGRLHASWTAVPGAVLYRVSYAAGPVGDGSPELDTSSTSIDLPALQPGQAYQVAVAATNAVGTGPRSASVTATSPIPPAPPTQVAVADQYSAEGVLDQVHVTWTASPSAPASYLVFRSADGGTTWEQRGSAGGTTFDDALPAADLCTRLRYRVASQAPLASSPRSADEAVRGTLLQSSTDTAELGTEAALSPYLVEGSVSLDSSFFRVQPRTLLCVGPGATLSVADGANFLVYGMLRVVGTPAAPATLQAHGAGGAPATVGPLFGVSVHPDDTVSSSYDPATGRGTLVEYARLEGFPSLSFGTPWRLHQAKVTARADGTTLLFQFDGAASVTDCTFVGYFVTVVGAFAAAPTFEVKRNLFHLGVGFPITLNGAFAGVAAADMIGAGQVTGNAFAAGLVSTFGFTASGVVPLGGNYWGGEAPSVIGDFPEGVAVTGAFDPVLATAPVAGATW